MLSMYIDAAIQDTGDNWIGADVVVGAYKGNSGNNARTYTISGLDSYWIYEEDFVFNLQHIDKNTTQGTFSGTLKNDQGKRMKIANGEFYVKVNYKERDT